MGIRGTDESDARHWVCALRPSPDRQVPVPHCTPELLSEATAATGPEPVAWALQVGAVAAEKIFDAIPYFGSTPEMRDMLYAATESITLGALKLLTEPDHVPPPSLTEEAKRAVSYYAQHDVPVERILRGIRFGHAEMSSAFLAACESLIADPEDRATAASAVSARLFEHVDRYGEEGIELYRTLREYWVTSSTAVTRRLVESILADDADTGPDSAGVTGTDAELPYELDQLHRAVIITRTTPTASGLQQVAHHVLRRLGAGSQLIVPVSPTTVWAWAGRWRPAGTDQPAPEGLDGFRIAVGREAANVAGFRDSHRDATEVHGLLELRDRPADVMVFDDVELALLLTRDLPAARRFVDRVLGPLAEANQRNQDITDTVKAYLDLGGSPSAVAERLNLARNTVSARIARASTVLRRDVGMDSADLHAALTLVEVLGDRVLSDER